MLAVISPAKKLDFENPRSAKGATQPQFLDDSEILVEKARTLSPTQLARTMKLSAKLAELNHARFQAFSVPFTPDNAKPAALVFNGDTYAGLDAATLDDGDMAFAQDHLRILSGLYGLLRPLDLIQPYRLEMGARFKPPRGGDLYGFWDGRLTAAIDEATRDHADPTVVNLASKEYFTAVHENELSAPVITPVFKDIKDGQARVLGMFAKHARGAMARFIVKNRVESPHQLKAFDGDGYGYRAELSDDATWVYTREQPPPVN